MTTKNKQADDAISRAARFMVAGAVEPDEARAAELHRIAAEMMVQAAQQLSGHFGDAIPRRAVESVRDRVIALVIDHFRRLVPEMAPELVGIASEADAARIVKEQFARSTPIKQ
jgi:hypothetical protein